MFVFDFIMDNLLALPPRQLKEKPIMLSQIHADLDYVRVLKVSSLQSGRGLRITDRSA